MVCMYLHVLYSVCVCIIYYTCIQQMYVCTQRSVYCAVCMRSCVWQQYTCCAVQYGLPMYGMPLVYSLCMSHTCCTQCAIYSLVCLCINKKALCIIHNAYIKFILISNIFYLFWRARKMRGHPVTFQNSGNTFVVCFSDIFEIKSHQELVRQCYGGWYFGKKIFFVLISTLLWATLTRKIF